MINWPLKSWISSTSYHTTFLSQQRKFLYLFFLMFHFHVFMIYDLRSISWIPEIVPKSSGWDLGRIIFKIGILAFFLAWNVCQLINFFISVFSQEWNLDELMESIWNYTKMIRIYTKVSICLFFNASSGLMNFSYYVILFCIVLYCIVLYCIVLYCNTLYCIVLYCVVLYCGQIKLYAFY